MADLKRKLFDLGRQYQDLARQHHSLTARFEHLQREHDQLLTLLIGLARESQERAWNARTLRVRQSTLADQTGWAIVTDVAKSPDYVDIRAVRQLRETPGTGDQQTPKVQADA